MTLIELTLKTAIKEAGEFLDVRLSKEEAEYILNLLKEQEKRINELEEKCIPIELFLEVLEKYKESDSCLIWERSTQIKDDLKKTGPKEENRFSWLEKHPEDIPLDVDNQKARKRGYDEDGIKAMMAAVCMKAIVDYKHLIDLDRPLSKAEKERKEECLDFFVDDYFQYFTNQMPLREITKIIARTPSNQIHSIWRKALSC